MQLYKISVCRQCRIALLRHFHSSLPAARSTKPLKAYAKRNKDVLRAAATDSPPTFRPQGNPAFRPVSSTKFRSASSVKPIKKFTPEDVRILLRHNLSKWAEDPETSQRLTSLGVGENEVKALLAVYEDHIREKLSTPGTPLNSDEDEDPWDIMHLWTGGESDKQAMVNRALLTQLFLFASKPGLEIRGVTPESLYTLQQANEALDLRFPAEAFPIARARTRKVYLHVGPTNSGKTYNALRALAAAPCGVYAGPLRLLAHEVWERLNRGSIRPHEADPSSAHLYARECNLITGEEQRIVSVNAGLTSCTVEMIDLFKQWNVCVIDEIQMIADSQRGAAWTAAVLGVCADELHLCGEEAAIPLIEALMKETGDELMIKRYKRLTPLAVAEKSLEGRWDCIEKGDCVVTFSRRSIFELKRLVEQATGLRCAVAYGRLPPETRSEQAALFNDRTSGYDVIVATDAIGMGLNLKIKRIVFVQLTKHNGVREVPLSLSQIRQIGGRAGRFGERGDASSTGIVTCLSRNDLPFLTEAFEMQPPLLHKAVVPFHIAIFTRVAQLLPETFGIKDLTSLLHAAARMGPSYTLPNDGNAWKGMEVIDKHGKDLRLVEKMQFAVCPTSWRSDLEAEVFESYLRRFASGEAVDLQDSLQDSHMLSTLERVTETRTEHKRNNSEASSSSLRSRGYQVQNVETLATLETLHKVLVAYIWLAFRMPLSFHQQAEATRLKEETEMGIEFLLEGMGERKLRRKAKTFSQLRAESAEGAIRYTPREPKNPLYLRRAGA